ncbi:MAG: ROK family protein [Acidimicrobiia bacterium]|nr:ROK family protein [Acidimicrobiia bacterium]
MVRIGIDLGGTKIEAIALGSTGEELVRRRRWSPRSDYRAIVAAIADLVDEVEHEVGAEGTVGVGHPGTISPASGLIKNSNSTVLLGKALDQDLQDALGRPVRLANDADCFALSEATDGAGSGRASVFGAILGTGVGGGVVINGHLLHGPNAIAGEWGHNPLPPSEADPVEPIDCYCGRSGCIEKYLSGPGLAADHARATGAELVPEAIVEAAGLGDSGAVATMHRYVERLAAGLAVVINVLDPDVVVLGGGLSNVDMLYERVAERWRSYVFSDVVDTELLRNQHGDSSGVRGAAWLWDRNVLDSGQ